MANAPADPVNSDFAEWSGEAPEAWGVRSDKGQKLSQATGMDHGQVDTALQVDLVAQGGGKQMEIYQALDFEPGTRYRVSADLRSTESGIVFLQAKTRRNKQEIDRFSSPRSTSDWQTQTVEFDSTNADEVLVLFRVIQDDDHVGQTAWMTNLQVQKLGKGAALRDPMDLLTRPPGSDQYVTPTGAGQASGTDWDNARPSSELGEALAAAGPGHTVYIGSGDYGEVEIDLDHGGLGDDRRLTLKGQDTCDGLPRFVSDFDRSDPSLTGGRFLTLRDYVGFVTVEGLRLEGYNIGVTMYGPNRGVRITDVDINQAREGFQINGGAMANQPDSGTHDLILRDCDIQFYTKRGVRIRNGVYNAQVINCTADAGGAEWYSESFPMGFSIEGSKSAGIEDYGITFEDCVARNNMQTRDRSYWNGDGFCAERGVRDITYRRCSAFGNTDGGWDFKSENTVLEDCVAFDNKRNIRIWSSGSEADAGAKLINCIVGYTNHRGGSGNANGVHLSPGANVQIERTTFVQTQTGIDLDAQDDRPAPQATVRSSLFYLPGGKASEIDAGAKLEMIDCVVIDVEQSGSDPSFVDAHPGWEGGDHAFNSQTYPNTSYRFTGEKPLAEPN